MLELARDPNATLSTVPVVLPVALDQSYDYLVGETGTVESGDFVLVPFGPQVRIGIVWDAPVGEQKPLAREKLKALAGIVDVPRLPVASMRFAEWIAKYTLSPLGMVVRMMMGARAAFEPEKPRFGVQIVPEAQLPPRMTEKRSRAIEIAADGLVRAKSELARLAGCTSGVIDGLARAGVLVEVTIPEKTYAIPDPDHAKVEFDGEQAVAVHTLRSAVDGRNFSVSLLDGVTGSGKTEVYYEAVAAALTSSDGRS